VQEGSGSLFNRFDNPATEVSSTWWVSQAGTIEQYVDANLIAWGQAAGNGTYNSVETEGWTYTALTEVQINALARLYRWGHDTLGWPYAPADTPGERGYGWHGMGGVAWGNHPNCPGDLRKNARTTILQLASGLVIPGGTQQPPLQPPASTLENDMFVVITAHDPNGGQHDATFDGAHKHQIYSGVTLKALLDAGVKLVDVDWGDYQAIPDAV
jgi:hypothetical protein